MGLGLTVSLDGDVVIDKIHRESVLPAALKGAQLLSIEPSQRSSASRLSFEPTDLIEEPDALKSAAALRRFFRRQDEMAAMLRAGPVEIVTVSSGAIESFTVEARATRPLADLPVKLWLQLGVALTGLLVGAWLVCLRVQDRAAWMFMLAGVGLAMASGSAAVYSARELALSLPVFATASRINSIGSLTFGIGVVTLFLMYPRRIVPRGLLLLPTVLIGGVIAFIQLADWPRYVGLMQDAIVAVMLVLLAAIMAQVVVNRRDPRARAMLGWFGLSIAIGAGAFVMTSVVPTLLNLPPFLEQSTAFLFFLLIYVGIAMGVLRYRLFDLGTYAFGLLFYGVGAALLLLLDAAFIFGFSLDRAPALGLALGIVGMAYLPVREVIARWLRRNRRLPAEVLYQRITEIAHAEAGPRQQALLQSFWADLFNPLHITPTTVVHDLTTKLENDGAILKLAPVAGLPGLELEWAHQGGRLFSSADLSRAKSLNTMIESSLRLHHEYVEAVAAERQRINRDMHDNIGVLLLGALHASKPDRKDHLIRQTMSDLREIISNPNQTSLPLPQLVADLRVEMLEHLDAARIVTQWHDEGLPSVELAPQVVHTLRSLLRETINNVIRHSSATAVDVSLAIADGGLRISVQDNGKGFKTDHVSTGNGLTNLASRVEQVGGRFAVATSPAGTLLSATLSLSPPMAAEPAAQIKPRAAE
ncbi:sensor histidine kinase [Sulfitobacter brevis]|uniref:sensor histidine kinase n=1 Tax=Sulfitobacter brevis TaxID=74348 RepID=UPI001FE93775|nr:ATP-binding protein [Sulfitobacter brevis]